MQKKERKLTRPVCVMRFLMSTSSRFTTGTGDAKRQKDGRDQCEKKEGDACHGRTGECKGFTVRSGYVGG
jgi:hypothetical protein